MYWNWNLIWGLCKPVQVFRKELLTSNFKDINDNDRSSWTNVSLGQVHRCGSVNDATYIYMLISHCLTTCPRIHLCVVLIFCHYMYLGRKSNLFVYTMFSTYHMPVYTTFLRHLGCTYVRVLLILLSRTFY